MDLGTGYGALGVVAARLAPEGRVYLMDINSRAVALAAANLVLNGIENAVALVSDGFGAVPDLSFTTILLNPPIRAGKRVYYPWLNQAKARLVPGGRLWVVIREQQGAPSLERQLRGIYPEVAVRARAKGYRVFVAGTAPE